MNSASDARSDSLRISIDTKAVLKLGELSRGGRSRGKEAVKAQDKDLDIKEKLVPFGILEVLSGKSTIVFGTSRETSDFIVDCLELWWKERRASHGATIRELVINLDNGPELASNRTQFIKRIIEFADRYQLEIHLVYYPPYHSKYNPVERVWGILENHWNGTLLVDRETAIEWAKTMTWKGISPIVRVLDKVFETGAKVAKKAFQEFQARLNRNPLLPKWDVLIKPNKNRRRARKLADQAWEAADNGNYDLAVKIVRRAVDLDPGNPVFWNDQGMLLKQLGNQSKAAESFLAAISLVPNFAEAYAHLAEIRIRQGLVREAVALQQAAVRHAPESTHYAEALVGYQAMTGQYDGDGPPSDGCHLPSFGSGLCPIEHSLRCSFPALASAVDKLDWDSLEASLTAKGYVLIRELLGADICWSLRKMFHEDNLYRKTVVMNKGRFGRGCYQYFAAPIPESVDAIRRIVYPFVAQVANAWQQMLNNDKRFPVVWEGFRIRCEEAHQTTPTPLILRYEAGGFNDLHRDIRGEVFFPIQMAIVLSPRGDSTDEADGFHGGDFLFCDDLAKKKSDRQAIPAGLGDAILFCTRARLVQISGVYGWKPVKHGVDRITSGTRYVLGVPFHEYQ